MKVVTFDYRTDETHAIDIKAGDVKIEAAGLYMSIVSSARGVTLYVNPANKDLLTRVTADDIGINSLQIRLSGVRGVRDA